jgi:hypothetical protein
MEEITGDEEKTPVMKHNFTSMRLLFLMRGTFRFCVYEKPS